MMLYAYKLSNIRIIDGDSIEATFDRGMEDYSVKTIRMYGLDAPESRTRDPKEKKKGLVSKDWLINRIETAVADGYFIICQSHKQGKGKYGRVLGTILIVDDHSTVDVNKEMISLGLAKPYFGGKRK